MQTGNIRELYKNRIDRLNTRLAYLENKSSRYSWNRLKIFIAGLALTIASFLFAGPIAGWIVLAVSTAVFSVAVHMHNIIILNIKRFRVYIDIYKENYARAELNWDKIPGEKILPFKNHPFETDLDITGERSIHRLMDTASSKEGSELLRELLTETKPIYEDVKERTGIVKELISLDTFRKKMIMKVRLLSKNEFHLERLSNIISKVVVKDKPPQYILYVLSSLIVIYLTLLILYGFDVVPSVWLFPFVLYLGVYNFSSKKIEHVYEDMLEVSDEIRKLSAVFRHLEKLPAKRRNDLKEFLRPFIEEGAKPSSYFESIEKSLDALESSHNPVMKIVLNFVMPWDYYHALRIWKGCRSIEGQLKGLVEKVYRLEALSSLANYAELNPQYIFAETVQDKKFQFDAKQIGHPLIPDNERICNDFSFTKEREIDIITGSNMSGKSTFIKTLGTNLAVAYAGGPVCAESMSTSLYRIYTCIKVSDSVTDGLSYFYSEVKRLRELLTQLEKEDEKPLLFLIDEIFKGTNNRERLIGSRSYINSLAGKNGAGSITTHDLELVKLEDEIPSILNYHFREEVKDGKMIFDYQLYTGPCPTTNALKVMKMGGLPVRDDL